jgi:hypothetical protein
VIASQVISNFVQELSFHFLSDDPAIPDYLASRLQDHRPKSDSIVGVTSQVAFDPPFGSSPIHGSRIMLHHNGIGKDQHQRVRILGNKFAEDQPLGFQNVTHDD